MSNVKLFEDKKVRSVWSEKEEKWYFSIVDVVEILTGSSIPKRYWSDLKRKLKSEGNQSYENIVQLKMLSSDGKKYNTDAVNPTDYLKKLRKRDEVLRSYIGTNCPHVVMRY